jgi:hypothetical protein
MFSPNLNLMVGQEHIADLRRAADDDRLARAVQAARRRNAVSRSDSMPTATASTEVSRIGVSE